MSVTLANPENEPITPGNQVLLQVTFKNSAGALTDPPTVTLTLMSPPHNEVTTPTAARQSQGVYQYEYEPETAGRYFFRWDGDGVAAVEGSFVIAESVV